MSSQLQKNEELIKIGVQSLVDYTNAIINHTDITPWYQKVRYIRLEITAIKSGEPILQLSEFGFRDSNDTNNFNRFEFPTGTTITSNQTGQVNTGETIDKILDNNTSTKYCVSSFTSPAIINIDLGENNIINLNTFRYYYYYTANDRPDRRDPISWKLYASSDGNTYTKIDERINQSITTNRLALAGIWEITLQ